MVRRSHERRDAHADTQTTARLRRATTRALFLLATLAAALAAPEARAGQFTTTCVCSASGGAFTLTTITPDGTFSDWDTVVTDSSIPANGNPRNNVCDQDASDNGESAPHPDRDWLVQSTGRDLEQFAFTWDSTNLYFYTRRYASDNNIQRFIYYGDADGDGLMEGDGTSSGSEPAVVIDWQGNNQDVTVSLYWYLESASGGDSMVDGSGYADGYDMPGKLRNGSTLRSGDWGSSDGVQVEFRVTWAELGLSGPTPIVFHVSSLNGAINNNTPPNQVDDNAGGCGGGAGSLQFSAVTLTPDRALSATHQTGDPAHPYSTLVCAAHSVTNDGNDDDIFNISGGALPSQATSVAYYRDVDDDGVYDAGGDTLLTDTAEPDAYSNINDADSTVDTGVLAAGATEDILACYTIDFTTPYTPSGSGNHVVTATAVFDSGTSDSVTNSITVAMVADPVMTKDSAAHSDPVNGTGNPKRIPGGFVTYSIAVTNKGGLAFDADSSFLTDEVPAGTALFVGDLGALGSGPVSQAAGSPGCALTYSFTALADVLDPTGDDVDFSDDDGATWDYVPTPDADGVDAAVTHIRINPKGAFAGETVAGEPTCTWSFRVRVE